MADGRIVDFPGKRKLQKTSYTDGDAVRVRLDFCNGETRTISLRPDMIPQYAAHGAEQKLGDECAGIEDVDDMTLAVDDLISRLDAGEWSVKREGSGFSGASILLRALVEVTGKSVEAVKTFLAGKTQAEKMALRAAAKVKPVVDRLEAEKASKAAKVDTESMLAELN
jgi:hypothetical protein